MNSLKLILLILLISSQFLSAAEPERHYKVVDISAALKKIDREEFKTWIQKNDPETYDQLFDEKGEKVGNQDFALIEYYLNQQHQAGWKLTTFNMLAIVLERIPATEK